MSKAHQNKFLYIISAGLMLFLSSCVDTSVENIPQNINYTSQVRFVNEVPGSGATITLDGSQVATVGTSHADSMSAYVEASSGSRNVIATFSSGQNAEGRIVLETDYKITVSIQEDTTGARFFVKTLDGYVWQ